MTPVPPVRTDVAVVSRWPGARTMSIVQAVRFDEPDRAKWLTGLRAS